MRIALSLILVSFLTLSGCSMVESIKPREVLKNPLGSDSLKRGMSKNEVKSLWGDPDAIIDQDRSKDVLHTAKEEWVYHARYSNLPVSKDYLGKSQRLYFDGDNLTSWKTDR